MSRIGRCHRETRETRVAVEVDLDGGRRTIDVPDGFLGHMLDALATHGGLGLTIEATGDLHVDRHHTVEDVGIALGSAIAEALGERRGIVRFAHAYAPLDEALARAVVDVSGRGFLRCDLGPSLAAAWITRDFPLDLVVDFFQGLADRGRLTLHLDLLAGRSPHHAAEALFKATALACRAAFALRRGDDATVPSTKGTLAT